MAKVEVVIEVTKRDISQGEPSEGERCAIALAVKRQLGDSPYVNDKIVFQFDDVSEKVEAMLPDYPGRMASLPKEAKRFIDKFDNDKSSVKPFSFPVKLSKKLARALQANKAKLLKGMTI